MGGMVLAHLARHAFERDIEMGTGFDYSTMSYVLTPGPTVRIVRYDPGGSITGPTTINGRAHYTHTTMAGAKALIRTASEGDWLLFPATTITFSKTSGVTPELGELANLDGPSPQYPFVLGTYDTSDPTNVAKYNKGYCTLDYSGIPWKVLFCFNLGRTERNVAITHFKMIGDNTENGLNNFYTAIGDHSNYLFNHLLLDPGAISTQGDSGFHDSAVAITSVGTTATIDTSGLSAGTQTIIDNCAVAGALTWSVRSSTPTAYNGEYVVTRTSATTYTFTFAGAAGVAASGAKISVIFTGVPDNMLFTNIIWNKVNSGNSGSFTDDGITLGCFMSACKHYRMYDCMFHHNGWGRSSDRHIRRPWTTGTMRAFTATHVGGLVTVLTSNTTGVVANSTWVFMDQGTTSNSHDGYRLLTKVINVVANTSFQYYVDPATAATAAGGNMTYCLMPTGIDATITLTAVGTTATATHANAALDAALVAGNLRVGIGYCNQTAYNGTWTVTRTSSTTFTYTMGSSPVSPATGTSITASMFDADKGGSPTSFNHNIYFSEMLDDIKLYRLLLTWDAANAKMTGGQYYIENKVHIRDPIGCLFGSNGNSLTRGEWPTGAEVKIMNDLQVHNDDIAPDAPRGYATLFSEVSSDSGISNGLLVHGADNPNSVNRLAYDGWANGSSISSYFREEHCMTVDWAVHDPAAATNTTKVYRHNISEDASALPGTKNVRWSDTSAGVQAKFDAVEALTAHTTFRIATPQLSGVVVGANDRETENNMCNVMLRDMATPYVMLLQHHFRQPLGR